MKKAEKQELLEAIEEVERAKGLDVSYLILTLFVVTLVFALIVPKIYLANEIYYKSRSINKLLDDYEILKEENRLLTQKLEYERYKNQVLDTIF